jgi:hypothetical protein
MAIHYAESASAERRKRIVVAAVLAIVPLITALSVFAHAHFIETRSLAGRLDGQEPEAHILVTVTAFNQVDWSIHKFLPIFTYSARYNKHIDQHPGAATPDAAGNYFYTSTPPLTFVVPWLFSKVVNADPSITLFRWYNVALQLAASLSLGALVLLCLVRSRADRLATFFASSCAVVIYMTAPESLKSHSINLWGQQLYAVLLPLQVLTFIFFPSRVALMTMLFSTPMTG